VFGKGMSVPCGYWEELRIPFSIGRSRRHAPIENSRRKGVAIKNGYVTVVRRNHGMAAKKFSVFVSSTYEDLIDERNELLRAILDLGQIPAGMELFGAVDEEQFEYIKKIIDECDYYILVIGGRYGSTDRDGVSYTEKEYDYAVKSGKVVLAFIHRNPGNIAYDNVEKSDEGREKLEKFRTRVRSGRLVDSWETKSELKGAATNSLNKAFNLKPGIGWVRGNAVANEEALAELLDLRKQNDTLKRQVIDLQEQLKPTPQELAGIDESYVFRVIRFDSGVEDTVTMSWREIARRRPRATRQRPRKMDRR
jgi:hypothetical protein